MCYCLVPSAPALLLLLLLLLANDSKSFWSRPVNTQVEMSQGCVGAQGASQCGYIEGIQIVAGEAQDL
jgi:hypothetical protein